ncbi:uncharacterized protein [Atheta coriaria]|uniref:uncharacterized protein n=1 Tax=Dalotia coriaria TaxID=877792 RepID=UPI0031F34084
MLKNGYIRNLDDEFMVRVVNIAQAGQSTAEFALSLLIHVLRSTRDGLSSNKSVILENLQLSLIMGHFKNIIIKNHETLYLRLFSLINSLISCAKGERRKNILKELNSPENHQLFYKFLKTHTNMTNIIAREVFVLQARLITSTYLQFYTNRGTVTASIFEEPNRNSNASEYDYLDTSNRNTVLGDGVWVSNLQKAESMCSILSLSSMNSKSPGSQLLHKCLEYGKKHYCTYFDSLEKSDYSCDAELYTISQNIISILTNLLCIGIPVHAHNYYLPMFFASREIAISSGMHTVEFFEELFVKTLMLLFHTKAEMRVKTPDDFKKLYQVLKIQLKLVFEKHPKDFEACDMHFSLVNYTTVQEILQKERDERWSNIYTKNPAVQELIQHFNDENLELVTLSRYNTLEKGFVFKNMTTKSGKYFSLKLTSDFQSLLYMDCARNGTEIGNGSRMCIPVSTIKYLVLAEKCNLRTSNLVPASQVKNVFTILYNLMDSYETDSIDCYFYSEDASKTPAESQKEMEELCNVWKDGLNLLLGKEYSQQMQNELNELNEFDCKMQLIELQDIEIPMGPAPPLPVFEYGAF